MLQFHRIIQTIRFLIHASKGMVAWQKKMQLLPDYLTSQSAPCYNTHQYAYTIYISIRIERDNLFIIMSCIQDIIGIQLSHIERGDIYYESRYFKTNHD